MLNERWITIAQITGAVIGGFKSLGTQPTILILTTWGSEFYSLSAGPVLVTVGNLLVSKPTIATPEPELLQMCWFTESKPVRP